MKVGVGRTRSGNTDRDDALKLARLSAMNQLSLVQVPKSQTRQWRTLIDYRHSLVARCAAIKNSIRSILERQGLRLVSGKSGWTVKSIEWLHSLSLPMTQIIAVESWRGQLNIELEGLAQHRAWLDQVNNKLDVLTASDDRVKRLQTIPRVGPHLSEMVVAIIDDPRRFKIANKLARMQVWCRGNMIQGPCREQGASPDKAISCCVLCSLR